MKIYIGADHAGFNLKKVLTAFLLKHGYKVTDCGASQYVAEDDYTDYVSMVAKEVSKDSKESCGIVIGGSGQGEAMVANKFPNVRAVVFNGQYRPNDGRLVPEEIMLTRQHNDANVLALGARFLSDYEATIAVDLWLKTPFSDEPRHARRIQKIKEIENNICRQ